MYNTDFNSYYHYTRHAQEVRMMYERKLETAERLCDQLDLCKRLIDQREHELDRSSSI